MPPHDGGGAGAWRRDYRLLCVGVILASVVIQRAGGSTTTAAPALAGEECDPFSDGPPCSDPNASCVDHNYAGTYTCWCEYPAFQLRESDSSCEPAQGYVGGSCWPEDRDRRCHDANAVCSQLDNTCQCTAPFNVRPSDLACVHSDCGGRLTSPSGTIVPPTFTTIPAEGMECVWTITTDDTHTVYLDTELLDDLSSDCDAAYIELWGGLTAGDSGAQHSGRLCHSWNDFHGMSSTNNAVNLRLFITPGQQNVNFIATWRSECERRMGKGGQIRSPGFPDSYPAQQSCNFYMSYNGHYEATLTFTEFNIPSVDSETCGNDRVQVQYATDMYNSNYQDDIFCGTDLPPQLIGVTSLYFVSGEAAGAGVGFEANFTKRFHCGKTNFTDTHGVFGISSNDDHVEGGCTWTITADAGDTILVHRNYIQLEENEGCNSEFIKVYDGPSKDEDKLIVAHCGSVGEGFVESTSNSVVVEFYTDGSNQHVYFEMGYLTVDGTTGCDSHILSDPQGSFALPQPPGSNIYSHSGSYHKNGECRWTITVEEGFAIQLAFQSFYINSYSHLPEYTTGSRVQCINSSLTVYDGTVEDDSTVMAELCGWDRPWLITSSSNNLLIVLVLGQEGGFTQARMSAQYMSVNGSQVNRECGNKELTGTGGVITSPNFPNDYDNLMDCEWVITVEPGFNVQVNVSEYSFDRAGNCMYDSVQVRDGGSIFSPVLQSPICDSWSQSEHSYWYSTSLSNQMFIKFVSNWEVTSSGFNWTWSRVCQKNFYRVKNGTLQSPYYPQNYASDLRCLYTFYLYEPGYRIVFNFTDFHLQPAASNGSCVDFIQFDEQQRHWFQGQFETTTLPEGSTRYCGDSLPGAVTTYYHTRVHFVTSEDTEASGFHLTFNMTRAKCGDRVVTGPVGTVTSPGYPGSFPNGIVCTQTIQVEDGETINLVFDDWRIGSVWEGAGEGEMCQDMWALQGRDVGSQLEIYDGEYIENGSVPVGIYCGLAAPLPFTSNSSNLTLVFRSFHNWQYLPGFSATFTSSGNSTLFNDCGGEVVGTEGTIMSPFYPEQYPNNSVCEWVITGDPGDTIRVSFIDFHLEDADSCQMDLLEFRDGSDEFAPLLDRLCGDVFPPDVTSTSNVMHVKFVSDFDASFTGFKVTWVSLCEEILRTESGTIQSPPNTGNNKQCTYIIEQPEWGGFVIRLEFQQFQLGGDLLDCGQNYVEIRDGGFEGAPLLGQRYCANDLPPVLTSSHSMMWIRFVSDGSASNNGFHATFSRGQPSCGTTTLTAKEDTFTTPSHPNNYPNSVNCTWEIVAEENHNIQLTFDSFLLEGPSNRCPWDWVKIYDGDDFLGEYCGSSAPDTITSTSNRLTVVFHSDWIITFDGFSASYISYDPSSDELTRQHDLYPFGVDNGDKQLVEKDGKSKKITIKTGFPVGQELQKKIFIGSKGLVSFGRRDKGKQFKLKGHKQMLCPYNSNINGSEYGDGGVFYQLYTDNAQVLNKATSEVREFTDLKDYKASLVLVVTWYRVQHLSSSNPGEERATVQLALTSNGQRSFGLVYYQNGGMKWPFLQGEPLIIGMSLGSPESIQQNLFSDTAEAFTSLDTIEGNTGRRGMWIYDVGDSYSADQVCQDWYTRNLPLNAERQAEFERLPQCPCSWWWLWGNWRWSHWRAGYDVFCFRMTVGSSRSVAPYGKECCYSADWWNWGTYGQYLSDAPHAGSATAFNPSFWSLRSDYQREDRQAHDVCCYNTTNSDYCRMYYELRPIGECTTRIPFRFSWTWGDPHIKTLDGGEYTFNGFGEYVMITMTSHDFTLQGRTGLAETESGTVTNATVFKAFGATENGISVTVDLDPNSNETMIIYGNGTDYTTDFYQYGNGFEVENDAYLLTNTNSSFKVTFTSGIQLEISVGYKSLDISVTMPTEFEGQTRGLLGNFNGVQGDDFVLPDGTTLASDLTDRDIYETFGPHWAVTESNTVLRYPPREGPADYAHPEFTPIFLDEQPADVKQAAEDLCGATNLACVYDYVATGSAAIASSTKDTADNADRRETVSKNTVPVLQFNATLSVMSGSALTFNLQGYDPDDGDVLTYYVVNGTNDVVQVDSSTGDVTVTLDASNPVKLSFYAKDSKDVQSPKRDVTVIVCPSCGGHGSCDITTAVDSGVSGFLVASCECDPAWTGPDCSEDYDACEESPCSAQQDCTDLTPAVQGDSETGFMCTECSDGFLADADDPTNCVDINECETGSMNCNGTCTNLPGSYRCGCQDGYRLNLDGVTCDDINECADRTAGCQQECVNTDGSFNCMCFAGYTLSDKGTCEADTTTADLCSEAGCAHGCTIEDGSASCFCNQGYVPDPNNSSACVDLDECQEGFCGQGCTNTLGSFACTCYMGHVLDSDQRTCSPCQGLQYGTECRLTCSCNGHAARCDPVTGCVCTSGWTGNNCEIDVDECEEDPDVCDSGQICLNTNGSYVCNCPSGYSKDAGGTCQDIDECADSLQSSCGELETCQNSIGSFYCSCINGYTRVQGECIDIDECTGTIKKCQQKCINREGSYNCDCYYGYRLDLHRTQCIQVGDVCKEFEGLDCSQGCTIDDVSEVAKCICDAGYKLATDGETCLDENECTSGTAGCSDNCINTPGGYNCSCPVGKKLDNDGQTCNDCPSGKWGDNCDNNCACGLGATGCDAVRGCQCKLGWTGEKCDQDVNECDTESAMLECQSRSAQCHNNQGSYTCRCYQGYSQDENGVCQDINECANSPCAHTCENVPGSYRCLCHKGFTLNSTTGQCLDVNECALAITHDCTQLCINTPGGYRCDCSEQGFVLDNDGVTCTATSVCTRVDCPAENGGCSQEECFCNNGYNLDGSTCERTVIDWCAQNVCEQTCTMSDDGLSYTCSCDNGFLLNADGSTCRECQDGSYGPGCSSTCTCNMLNTESCAKTDGACTCREGWEGATCDDDIDECSEPSSVTCPEHAQCVNTRGGYLCSCEAGYAKKDGNCAECDDNFYGVNCAQQCTCSANSVSCDKVNGACVCKSGWTGASCESDEDECTMGLHDCSGDHVICINTEGGFQCDCDQGYVKNETTGTCVDKDECFWQDDDCLHECTNTEGSYTCSCGPEYTGEGNDCQALTLVRMTVTVDIEVQASDLVNPYSETYKDWLAMVEQAMFEKLKPYVPSLQRVIVRSVRHGSLIAVTDCVVDTQSDAGSVSSLSSAILILMGGQLTIGNYTGDVAVNVSGIVVDQSMTLCDVYEAISPCAEGTECQEDGGTASCIDVDTESEEDDSDLGLIIGLSVSIPVVLLVGGVIAVCLYLHKQPNQKTLPLVHDEVYSASPVPNNLYDDAKHGAGPSDTHLRAPSPVSASPVPSLDSIFAVMEAQPVRRKGSWTDNM